MYDTDEELRKVARSVTHYAYRNTKLEDYHSDGVKMDGAFYKKIYAIVYKKLENVRLLHKYIARFPRACSGKEDIDELIGTVPEELQLKFIKYVRELVWGFYYGTQWDAAEVCSHISEGQNAAGYVLGGRFKECCEKGAVLDDKTMCYVNKDVHNRIYTLFVNGYFD